MNQLTCPACQTTQHVVQQWDSSTGALIVLDCAHAWELVRPHEAVHGEAVDVTHTTEAASFTRRK